MRETTIDILSALFFMALIGAVLVGVQMAYNSALECKATTIRCEELGCMVLANHSIEPIPQQTSPFTGFRNPLNNTKPTP